MNILISNDDGIFSEGLKTLAEVLCKENNVYVFAPDGNRSGYSHSVTFFKDIYFKECNISDKFKAFSLSGTPADCVKFGLDYLKDKVKIDLVCAGLNYGSNLGTDVYYSGTVSACTEANIFNIPSIAFSFLNEKKINVECAKKVILEVFNILKDKLNPNCVWNVNIPDLDYSEIKGIKFAKLGVMKYTDEYVFDKEENKYVLIGEPIKGCNEDKNCDVELCFDGYVVITPIAKERTDFNTLRKYGE